MNHLRSGLCITAGLLALILAMGTINASIAQAADRVYEEPDDGTAAYSGLLYVRYDKKKKRVDQGYPKFINSNTWDIKLGNLDGVMKYGNGRVYFFGTNDNYDNIYSRWNSNAKAVDKGYPKTVNPKTWPGVDMWRISGMVNWGNGKAYIFGYYEGDIAPYYIRYDIKKDRADKGYPNVLSARNWDKLKLYKVTAALNNWGGKVYLFGNIPGDNRMYYMRYDQKSKKADAGYPKLVSENWKGVGVLDEITGAVDWGNGKIYFFGHKQL